MSVPFQLPKPRFFSRFLVFALGLLCAAAPSGAARQGQTVQIEEKPRHISAGHGQPPFDVTRHLIPLRDIQSGGPPKDGIPALTQPAFVSAAEADHFLRSFDIVLGLELDGEAKAYPIRILNWHEVINDRVGPQPVLVSW